MSETKTETAAEFQHRCAELVKREVHYCVSGLVSTLQQGFGTSSGELGDLCEQATELCCPIQDLEEAAIQEGWSKNDNGYWSKAGSVAYDSLENLCESERIEPYDREVYEHWIVSGWLARKLEKHGEKVDRDFAGLTVWARTTTGQAISIDAVIEDIVKSLT